MHQATPLQTMTSEQPTDAKTVGRVLVVDDEEAILVTFRRILEMAGYTVETAASAQAAMASLQESNGFNAVISDITMPGADGLELLRKIRSHDQDVPVILMTGGPTLQSAIEAVELGALKYLTKPIARDDLLETIGYAVRMHRLAKAKREAMTHVGEDDALEGDRLNLEATFERSLEALWIAYQPIVSWDERRVWGYEALVRSDEPQAPHPGILIPMAERLGRLFDLGRKVRELVADRADSIAEPHHLFVNLHPEDLLDTTLYAPGSPLSRVAKRVVLELTERVSLDRIPSLQDRLKSLRDLGFRLAVDDLGAGYAGLSAFAQIEPDVAKIDMSLVRNVDKDPKRLRLIKAMVDVCLEMKIQVVNEGIETEAERDTLASIGCDLMQGYYFARPAREPATVEL